MFRGQEQYFWESWAVRSSLIQDRKTLLPDQKERLLVSFIMAAWRFQGTKQYQFVLCHIWEKQKALAGRRRVGKKDLYLTSNPI